MKVKIRITSTGTASGPFYDLYSSFDGVTFPYKFESEIAKSQLVAGYDSILVPIGTTKIRVQSLANGEGCTDYVDVTVDLLPIPVPEPTPEPLSPLYIGQVYNGGVIIEVSPDYSWGYIMKTTPESFAEWGAAVLGARAVVHQGYEDWGLPTTAQMQRAWNYRASLTGVTFLNIAHWASEEYSQYGLAVNMGNGSVIPGMYKWNELPYYAVRRFWRELNTL
jgi:hypothetical protein